MQAQPSQDTYPGSKSTGSAGHFVMPRPSPRVKHPSSCLTAGLSGLLTAVTFGGLFTAWSVAGGSRDKTRQPAAALGKKWPPKGHSGGKEAKPMKQQKEQRVKVVTRSAAPARSLHHGQALQQEWRPRSPQLQQEPLLKGNSTL